MRIQHNISALNSYRNYTNNTNAVSKNLEKLSSGYRINRAGDDAAGLAISEKMRAQITGLETAQKNAQDGVSLVQTAEGAMTEVHSMLNRMVELANQSANGTYSDSVDRENIQKEFKALTDEIDRIADATNFNGIDLLNGKLDGKYTGSISNAATGVTSGIDLEFRSDGWVSGASGEIGLEFDIKAGTNSANAVTVNASGKIEITLGTAAMEDGLSSSEILKLIKDAANNFISTATAINGNTAMTDSFKDAIKDLTVSGEGIIGVGSGAKAFTGGTFTTESSGDALELQIGDTSDDYNRLKISIRDMHAKSLKLDKVDVSNADSAKNAVKVIKNAINTVSSVRGDLGAAQNRLEHTMNNLSVTSENMSAAESRIRDTDVAKEMMSYTKNNILVQSAQAMLAQANQQPQGVLQLLQ